MINTQAFVARGVDARRIHQELYHFGSRKPIDIIAQTRPIIIIDEPQSVGREGSVTLKSMEDFKPPFTLRYSATHSEEYNKIYRLDAYNKKLVKKIQVKGINLKGSSGTTGYLYLEYISLTRKDGLFSDFRDGQGYGFRVYRLASSNMREVYYRPQDYAQSQLDLFADNVKEGRTAEDLVTQIMLDWGLELSLPSHGNEGDLIMNW